MCGDKKEVQQLAGSAVFLLFSEGVYKVTKKDGAAWTSHLTLDDLLVLTSVKNVAANNSATVDVTAQSGKAFIGKVTLTNETADEKVKLSATVAITPGAITVTDTTGDITITAVTIQFFTDEACTDAFDNEAGETATASGTDFYFMVTVTVSGDAAHSKITFSNAAAKADVAQVKTAIAAAVVSLSFTATSVPA